MAIKKTHYKKYKFLRFANRLPLRILKFKRSKWLRLKSRIQRLITIKRTKYYSRVSFRFYDPFVVSGRRKFWGRLQIRYIKKLNDLRILSMSQDFSVTPKALRKPLLEKNRRLFVVKQFGVQYYRLCNMIWYSKFQPGVRSARQLLNAKKVYVNHELVSSNKKITGREFISLTEDKNLDLSGRNIERYSYSAPLFSIAEVDAYGQTIQLFKKNEFLNKNDMFFLLNENLRAQEF